MLHSLAELNITNVLAGTQNEPARFHFRFKSLARVLEVPLWCCSGL